MQRPLKLSFNARPRQLYLAVLALLAGPAWAQPAEPQPSPLQLRNTPMLEEKLPERPQAPIIVSGERVTGRSELETEVNGEAELRRPGLTVRGDRIIYDQATDRATAEGHVKINSAGNRYTGTEGELQVDAFEGFVLQPTYEFLANGAYGEAERIDFLDPDRAVIRNASYTTCRRDGG